MLVRDDNDVLVKITFFTIRFSVHSSKPCKGFTINMLVQFQFVSSVLPWYCIIPVPAVEALIAAASSNGYIVD